jgi:uncharacterized protein (DUF342 family)
MAVRRLEIKASNEKAARKAAAKKFGIEPGEIDVRLLDNGHYSASMIGETGDADIVVTVTGDAMEAYVDDYTKPGSEGEPLTAEVVLARLKEAGVTYGIDNHAVNEVVTMARNGRNPVGEVLARGRDPDEAMDSGIDFLGEMEGPVFPGEVFATVLRSVDAKAGRTVTGQELALDMEGTGDPREIVLPDDGVLELDEEGGRIISHGYGLVHHFEGALEFEHLARVSEDQMEVLATVYPQDFKGEPIDAERYEKVLDWLEVKVPLHYPVLKAALQEAWEYESAMEDVVLASGKEPEDGQDGYVETDLEQDLAAGTEKEDGSIDFYERGLVRRVREGELLGTVQPPTRGKPGYDVFKRRLSARDGRPLEVRTGENVTVSADGTEFRAGMDGMVVFSRNHLDVTEVLEIKGDIDFSTGNVRTDKGSIHIKGSINRGFVVEGEGNIVVDGTIEGAKVSSGADVIVKGGIIMQGTGEIRAKGNINAKFATNANLVAEGDIVISNEIVQSSLSAGGKVIASSAKGKILGGTIKAAQGVVAQEIGSHMGVVSSIYVGERIDTDETDDTELKNLENTVAKIDTALGNRDVKQLMASLPEDKREKIEKLVRVREGARKRIKAMKAEAEAKRQEMMQDMRGHIRVRGALHSGTFVSLYGKGRHVGKDAKYCRITYDSAHNTIEVGRY